MVSSILSSASGALGYLWRNPAAFDARSASTIARWDLLPSALAALAALLSWGTGRRLLRWIFRGPAVPEGYAFPLGLGTLAWAVLLLAIAGRLNGRNFVRLGIFSALVAAPEFRFFRSAALLPRLPGLGWKSCLAALMALGAWHAGVTALAPPTEWDALAYHLALPKLYLKAGGIHEIPWSIHSHWPRLMEVLYAVPLAFGCDNAAALIHAAACAGLVYSVVLTGRAAVGGGAALAGAALFAAQPVVLDLAGAPHSDGAFALFAFTAVSAAWRWSETGGRGWLVLSGLLAGLAASAKLHGLVILASISVWMAFRRRRQAAAFLACGLLVAAPWYWLSWTGAGNPVWPFFSSGLGGRWGAAALEAAYLRSTRWTWPPPAALLLTRGPQHLLLPLAALAALSPRRSPLPGFLKFNLTLMLPYLLLVARQHEAWRFLFPFLPALALTAAWLAAQTSGRRRLAAAAAFAYGLAPVLSASANNQLFPVLGLRSQREPERDSREVYLERSLDHYRIFSRINRNLPARSKVLLFREIRGYYLDVDYLWGDPVNQGVILYRGLRDGRALLTRLAELGVTHVLVNSGLGIYQESPDYYDRRTLGLMEAALREGAKPVMRDGALTVYELAGL